MLRIGYLDYDYAGKRGGNLGGEIMYKIFLQYRPVERCAADQINNYDLVLVSVPSSGQMIDLYRLARKHVWDKRTCRILLGGFGVQNPNLLCGYADYAFYGRAHDCVEEIIEGLEQGGVHDLLRDHMTSVDNPWRVSFRQAPLMTDGAVMAEEFTGCPLKCKFCHYTYARKFEGKTNGYVQGLLTSGTSEEVLYQDISTFSAKVGRMRTAIDGFSERIRYLYGKRISNDLIVDGINHIGEIGKNKHQDDWLGGGENNRRSVMTVYNICNFPYETQDDEQEFIDTVSRANPASRVIFILHSTPFRASPATPMQWERVQVFPDWSLARERTVVERPNLLVKYSYTLEGPWSQMLAAIVERAKPQDQTVQAALSFKAKKITRAGDKTRAFMAATDLDYYLGEHDIDGDPPGAKWVTSYLGDDKLRKIARKMRRIRDGWEAPVRLIG